MSGGRNQATLPEPPPETKFALRAGDTIEVDFPYWPEFNITQVVRSDGHASFKGIADQPIVGLTPEELKARLQKQYAGMIKDPIVSVLVKSRANRQVYVGGEVVNPGLLTLVPVGSQVTGIEYIAGNPRIIQQERVTPVQAIMACGGFRERTAKISNVLIIRHVDGKRYAVAVDMRGALKAGVDESFWLEPNDVVYVPRSRIEKVNQWVDQNINNIIPRNLNFSFTKTVE